MTRLALVVVLVAPVSLFMAWAIGWWAAPLVIPYGLYVGYLVHLLPDQLLCIHPIVSRRTIK